ncbi:two-component sensor histidine kinase [Alicyclobacillus acidoterrestris]|nr:two-component sensor histidine kinase [Alicyclobacillus acidoterrestris]
MFMSHFLYENTTENIENQIRSVPVQSWLDANEVPAHQTDDDDQKFEFAVHDSTVSFINVKGNYQTLFRAPDADPAPRLSTSTYLAVLNDRNDNQHKKHDQVVTTSNGARDIVVLMPVGRKGQHLGVVQVSMSLRDLKHVLMQQLMTFIFLGIGALIVGLFSFLPTLRRTLVPLSQMTTSVKRVDAGNMDERITLKNAQSEIEVLASSFNSMLERLSDAFESERRSKEKMRQFVSDASHELRTPLTSIHGFVEVLLRGAASHPDQLDKALRSMSNETGRLSKLVQDLLTLARLDEERPLDLRESRLDQLIRDMEPQLLVLAGLRQVCLITNEEVRMVYDSDRMKQVVLNLFHNAVAHTDAIHGKIEISLMKDTQSTEQSVSLSVKDNGTGIPHEHLTHLFERFYRIDTDRSRKHGGAGLGLAISQSIVERHGGSITCESEVGKGTTFTIHLPIRVTPKTR